MAVKTTINNKGVFSETISGSDDLLVIDATQTSAPQQNVSISGTLVSGAVVTVSAPVTSIAPNASSPTASLPTIGSSNVGTMFWLIKSGANTNNIVVSGTNPIGVGSTWTFNLSGSNDAVQLLATSGSGTGYYWFILSHKNLGSLSGTII